MLFGTLEFVDDDAQFIILCFLIRGCGAVGASAFSTAGATFIANLFPDKVSAVMGILETFIGLGFSIGPVIGGSLYTLGGFQLPFYVLGAIMLGNVSLSLFVKFSMLKYYVTIKGTLPFNVILLPAMQPTFQKTLGSKVCIFFRFKSYNFIRFQIFGKYIFILGILNFQNSSCVNYLFGCDSFFFCLVSLSLLPLRYYFYFFKLKKYILGRF